MFFRWTLIYSAIVKNKTGMVYFLCRSAKKCFLSLIIRVWVKTHFRLKSPVLITAKSLFNAVLAVMKNKK